MIKSASILALAVQTLAAHAAPAAYDYVVIGGGAGWVSRSPQ